MGPFPLNEAIFHFLEIKTFPTSCNVRNKIKSQQSNYRLLLKLIAVSIKKSISRFSSAKKMREQLTVENEGILLNHMSRTTTSRKSRAASLFIVNNICVINLLLQKHKTNTSTQSVARKKKITGGVETFQGMEIIKKKFFFFMLIKLLGW